MRTDGVLDASSDPATNESAPGRRNLFIGVALLGIVLSMLAGAFLLDRQLRPNVGVEPSVSADTAQVAPRERAISSVVDGASVPGSAASSPVLEVEAAYLRYWDVYSAALLNLDASRLGEVAIGEELGRIQEQINGLRSRNRAVRVIVTHSYLIFDVSEREAKVYDEIENRSFTVDPVAKDPPQGDDVADMEKDTYFFQKMDGGWKVVSSVRQ